MWDAYDLTMKFTVPLCGSVPRSKKVIEDWVAVRAATDAEYRRLQNGTGPDDKMPKTLGEIIEEVEETQMPIPEETPPSMEKVWNGFNRDETGLFVRGGNIRAHIKSCADVLGAGMRLASYEGPPKKVNVFCAKARAATYVKEERVYILGADAKPAQEPTGYRDATQNVKTALGPRTCLKRVDYVFPATLRATLLLLRWSEVTIDHIKACFEYGMVQGFGQDRSLQFGRYEWRLTPSAG